MQKNRKTVKKTALTVKKAPKVIVKYGTDKSVSGKGVKKPVKGTEKSAKTAVKTGTIVKKSGAKANIKKVGLTETGEAAVRTVTGKTAEKRNTGTSCEFCGHSLKRAQREGEMFKFCPFCGAKIPDKTKKLLKKEAETGVMMENGATAKIYNYLKDGNSITSKEAFRKFGVTRLSSIIFNLRGYGVRITSVPTEGTTRYGGKCTFSTYRMEPGKGKTSRKKS